MPVSVLNSRVKWLCDQKPRSRATCTRGCESSRSMTSAAASRRRLMNGPRLSPTVFRNFLAKRLGEQPTSDAKSFKWKCWLGRASIKSTICLVTVAVKTLSSGSESGFRPPRISASRKINRRAAISEPMLVATPWSGVVASRSMHSRSTESSRGRVIHVSLRPCGTYDSSGRSVSIDHARGTVGHRSGCGGPATRNWRWP